MDVVKNVLGKVSEDNVVSKTTKKTLHQKTVAKDADDIVDNIL